MPVMIRTSIKAQKIIESIIGKPANMNLKRSKKMSLVDEKVRKQESSRLR